MELFGRAAINQMRRFNRAQLRETATISIPITTVVSGFEKTTWQSEQIDVPCRLSPSQVGPSPGEVPIADVLTSRFVWLVVFDSSIRVHPKARITVSGTDILTGEEWTRKLEVKAVSDPHTSSVMTKAYCWEMT